MTDKKLFEEFSLVRNNLLNLNKSSRLLRISLIGLNNNNSLLVGKDRCLMVSSFNKINLL